MPAVIHLGVIEIPYEYGSDPKSTGDIAEILEGKYHIMEHFWQAHQSDVIDAMSESIVGALENALMGAPTANIDPHAAGSQEVEAKFHDFLTGREMDGLGYPGIPTQAAQMGVSHRFKNPRGKRVKGKLQRRPPRPSFIDTGMYLNSFRVWVDEEETH